MQANPSFPLKGVIGVVSKSSDEVNQAVAKGLQCIELRADLLIDNGLNEADILDLVSTAKKQCLGVLFTLRLPSHGGTYRGSESDRVDLSLQAIAAGADLFDLEFGSDAVSLLPAASTPGILSYHDFSGMPTDTELQSLTVQMERVGARAIKVVPTARSLDDALTMLKWTGQGNGSVSRIGFAMGEAGACSRILTTLLGGEVSYASFGAPVAPGQVDIDELKTLYRIDEFDARTTVTAVCIDGEAGRRKVEQLNKLRDAGNRVALGFPSSAKHILEASAQWLRIAEILT